MNCNYIKNITTLGLALGVFILTSCEPDDICLAEEAPFVTLKMYYPNSDTDLEDTIFYKAYVNDTLLIESGSNEKDLTVLNLPILTTENRTIKYILEQGSTYKTKFIDGNDTVVTTHQAPQDIIYVNYQIDNKFNSKACGFGVFFKDATFTTSNNWIQNLEIVNTTIDDATSTNLNIFAEPRSY